MTAYSQGFSQANALELVSQYDIVVDATDNAPSRYLISDACVVADKPLVSGAAIGTDGQLTVYHYGEDGPCYRCLFPQCPAPNNCARCCDAGVLGPVPGVIGSLQAVEAVKLLSGVGRPLSRRLLLFDALAGRMQTVNLRARRQDCAACGQQPAVGACNLATYDYAAFTGGQVLDDAPPEELRVLPLEQRVSATRLRQALEQARADGAPAPLVLDVRPPVQFDIARLPGSVNVPFDVFDKQLDNVVRMCRQPDDVTRVRQQPGPASLPGTAGGVALNTAPAVQGADAANGAAAPATSATVPHTVYVVCRRGNDSQLAVQRLRQAGIDGAVDVMGGLMAWARECDVGFPTY